MIIIKIKPNQWYRLTDSYVALIICNKVAARFKRNAKQFKSSLSKNHFGHNEHKNTPSTWCYNYILLMIWKVTKIIYNICLCILLTKTKKIKWLIIINGLQVILFNSAFRYFVSVEDSHNRWSWTIQTNQCMVIGKYGVIILFL